MLIDINNIRVSIGSKTVGKLFKVILEEFYSIDKEKELQQFIYNLYDKYVENADIEDE